MSSAQEQSGNIRPDLQVIVDLVEAQSLVLDLGCGDGSLLEFLTQAKKVRGRGIELHESGVMECVRRGLSVRQGNLNEGLEDYPDQSMDYVVLSQTLHYLNRPGHILDEMLRVGRHAIVSFPNWGYWRSRLTLVGTGRIPQAPTLPEVWYATRRWQAFTIADFQRLCLERHYTLQHAVYLVHGQRIRQAFLANLLATTGIFVLQKDQSET